MPAALSEARDWVYRGDYGAALRTAEQAGAQPGANTQVQASVARLAQIAAAKIQNRVDRAEEWYAAGERQRAAEEYRGILTTFRGTSLESRAQALHDAFVARTTGRPG